MQAGYSKAWTASASAGSKSSSRRKNATGEPMKETSVFQGHRVWTALVSSMYNLMFGARSPHVQQVTGSRESPTHHPHGGRSRSSCR